MTTHTTSVPNPPKATTTSCSHPCQYYAQQGWECPRCHKINAPWMSQCNCSSMENWEITCDSTPSNVQQWYINGSDSISGKKRENITAWSSASVTTKEGCGTPTSYSYEIEKGE